MIVGPKSPNEVKVITFDFSNQLGAAPIISTAITVKLLKGTDPAPGNILTGSTAIAGAKVTRSVAGGVLAARYDIICLATDSAGGVHQVSAQLEIGPI